MTHNTLTLSNSPSEIIRHLLSYIDIFDLWISFRTVSHLWNKCSQDIIREKLESGHVALFLQGVQVGKIQGSELIIQEDRILIHPKKESGIFTFETLGDMHRHYFGYKLQFMMEGEKSFPADSAYRRRRDPAMYPNSIQSWDRMQDKCNYYTFEGGNVMNDCEIWDINGRISMEKVTNESDDEELEGFDDEDDTMIEERVTMFQMEISLTLAVAMMSHQELNMVDLRTFPPLSNVDKWVQMKKVEESICKDFGKPLDWSEYCFRIELSRKIEEPLETLNCEKFLRKSKYLYYKRLRKDIRV